jgi:hypothetical protein
MVSNEQMQALKKSLIAHIEKAFAPLITEPAPAAGEDVEAEAEAPVKLTPREKLEKQLEGVEEKLTNLKAKMAGGKSKIPGKDIENQRDLEEKISKINEKIAELDTKGPKKASPKPSKAEEAPKAAEAKKHVPRITPAMTTRLKETFDADGIPWDDKYKKEFVTYVNSLSNEQFATVGLETHMWHFMKKQTPAAEGGAGKAPDPKPKIIELDEIIKAYKKDLTQHAPGIFKNKITGELVTGPAEDIREDLEEKEVDGEIVLVGEKTKRVYKPAEGDGNDVFIGYWGVGVW